MNHPTIQPAAGRALAAQGDALRDKTVVSYCTGGIRCEKAALQLNGGMLRSFEQVGRRRFDGDCLVLDERVALDAGLVPSGQT